MTVIIYFMVKTPFVYVKTSVYSCLCFNRHHYLNCANCNTVNGIGSLMGVRYGMDLAEKFPLCYF